MYSKSRVELLWGGADLSENGTLSILDVSSLCVNELLACVCVKYTYAYE